MSKYPPVIFTPDDDNAQAKLVKLVGSGRRVLEFGCASGYVSKILTHTMNCSVVGLEADPEAAQQAENYCERVVVCDVEQVDFPSLFAAGTFDVATFGDVLEHLYNPTEILRKVKEVLAPNGFIVASIPNISHISVVLELLEGRFDYCSRGLLDESHIRFFTKKSILAMMRDAGYEVIQWDRVVRRPEETEFATSLASYPDSLVSFLGDGEEGFTYQFVIKAVPCRAVATNPEQEQSALREARHKIRELESRLAVAEERGRELSWVYGTLSWRLTKPLRMLMALIRR